MNPFETAMQEVLQQSRYDRLTGRAVDFKKMIADAAKRVIEFILDKFSFRLPDLSTYNTDIFSYLFLGVGLLLLLVAIGVTVRILARRRRKPSAFDLSELFEELAQKQYTVSELLALSQEYASDNRWREAVRYRFIALLAGLNEQRVIRIGVSKTNAQLARDIAAAAPELAGPFEETAECFHYVWFGHKPVPPEQFTQFTRNVDRLLKLGGCDAS